MMTSEEITDYLHLLEETPKRIAVATEGCTDEELHSRPDESSWSVNEVLAHLRACVDVWSKDIRRMLAEDNQTWHHLSPRTWMRKTDYADRPFHESFAIFAKERQELMTLLSQLPLEDWSRSANVIQSGKERKQTVFLRARQMAMHEEGHCKQIEEIVQ